jgi:hypothetical protein
VVCSGLELGPTEVETRPGSTSPAPQGSGQDSQERAGQWAAAQGAANGSLPNGKQIASHFGRLSVGAAPPAPLVDSVKPE